MPCSQSHHRAPRSLPGRLHPIALAGAGIAVFAAAASAGLFLLGIVGVVVSGLALLRASDSDSRAARAGAVAERHVAGVLTQLDARHELITNRVIPGLKGRAPEADIIVVRADSVFVVEVKHSVCSVFLRGSGMVCTPDRGAPYTLRDPRPQARKQARSVRRFLSDWGIEVPVYSAVVVLAPKVTIQGGLDLPVFTSAEAVRAMIRSTRSTGGRGGDPRAVLARLPFRDRVRSRP